MGKFITTKIREYINEQHSINENDIERWMTGECIPFCVALNDVFPQYQIAKDLYEDFYYINPIIDWDIPNSKYLINNYAGKKFASEESFEYDINEFQSAKEYITKNIDKYSVNLKWSPNF
mgnify:CR=1 FL=1